MHDDPTFEDVRAAAQRIAPHIHRTPVATCASIDAIAGASLFFKCENLQKVGAFKARGAMHAIGRIPAPVRRRGVATFWPLLPRS